MKIDIEQIKAVLTQEVLKRDVIESEKADEARKKVNRAINRILKTKAAAANGGTLSPPNFGQTGFSKGRFAGCVPALGREEEDSFLLSQRLPLQRAKRASGRAGLTCGRAYGVWIIGAHSLSHWSRRECRIVVPVNIGSCS